MVKTIFSPVRSKRTFDDVSSQIKRLILDGVLQPGDKLPPEGELSDQLKVGRQTVREALRILELSGFIAVQKGFGGGSIVRNGILDRTSSLLLDALQMGTVTVKEFTTARLLIEGGILQEAMNHADQDDIRGLQQNLIESRALIARGQLVTDHNFAFHSLLAKASKNSVYIVFERTISALLYDLRRRSHRNFIIDQSSVRAHEQILNALIKRDREKGMTLLERHIAVVSKFHGSSREIRSR